MLAKVFAQSLLIGTLLGACSRMEDKQMVIGAEKYFFPSKDIVTFMEPGEGSPYVRLRPTNESFDLIYSLIAERRRNWADHDAPLVTSVSDHPAPKFEEFDFPSGKTVCRDDQPHYACGFSINDNGVIWSVVFGRDQVGSSEALRKSAVTMLNAYRS